MENAFAQFRVVAQRRIIGAEKILENLTHLLPRRAAQREKIIQRIAIEEFLIPEIREMSCFFQNGEVHDVLAETNTGARSAIARFENAEWKILQRKMRIRRDLDK